MRRKVSSAASKAGTGRGARRSRKEQAPVQARPTKSPVWESSAGPHIYTRPGK